MALENSRPSFISPEWTLVRNEDIAALREALAKPDFWEGYVPEPVKPAQQEPVALLQEIARLHDRIKDLERDVEFLSLPAHGRD